MKRAHALGAGLGALLAGLRCQPIPATEVLVRFAADSELRSRAARLEVEVRSQEGELVLEREKALSGTEAELARVPVVPRDDDASRFFSVRGELFDAAGASLGVERAMLGYVEDELTQVLLVFDSACATVADCGEGRRCQAGSCVGACVDPVSGHAEQESPARCSSCERCAANRCDPLEDGAACGCAEDRCRGGSCVVATRLLSVALGIRHTCALTDDNGPAYCWGANDVGQLGLGTSEARRTVPTPVLDIDSFWRGLHIRTTTSCVLAGDAARHCWGENYNGQFGSGTSDAGSSTPLRIDSPELTELSAGGGHFCGMEAGGAVWCWGYNERGQLGIGAEYPVEPTPQRVPDLDDARQIDAGGLHTCAIRQDDTLWCWGYNDSGQVGVGDLVNRTTPERPGCAPGQTAEACIDNWQSISLGTYHTCAVRKGGELWCWGGNGNAQLGVSTTGTNERSPLPVTPKAGWAAVSAGHQHTCAIREDGSLWCWGNGERGQLGNGERDRSNVPARVLAPPGSVRWEQVATAGGAGPGGGMHTCALRSDRTLWCWGRNDDGQLGLGFTSESVTTPRRVCLPP